MASECSFSVLLCLTILTNLNFLVFSVIKMPDITSRVAAYLRALDRDAENATFFRAVKRYLFKFRLLRWSQPRIMRARHRVRFWGDPMLDFGPHYPVEMVTPSTEDGLASFDAIGLDFPEPLEARRYKNVRYSANGFAWMRHGIDMAACCMKVTHLRLFWQEAVLRPKYRFDKATIVQSFHPFTYGDWVTEHMISIANACNFPQPLLLPGWIGNRPYVKRELERAGISFVSLDGSARIKEATVLFKQHALSLIFKDDVDSYRDLFKIDPPAPETGSIIYLSREGLKINELAAKREYPSREMAEIVRALGGQVVDTSQVGFAEYVSLATKADIVIADHGAALMNLMLWRSSAVIEIVDDKWWSSCFVYLSSACGSKYHGVMRHAGRTKSELEQVLGQHLSIARSDLNDRVPRCINSTQEHVPRQTVR